MNRRRLLSTASIGAVLLVSGCATFQGTPEQIAAQVFTDIQAIATGLGNAATLFKSVAGIPTALINSVTTIIAEINANAALISSATIAVVAQPTVQNIEKLLGQLVTQLAGTVLPASISAIIQAAEVLLPVVEIAIGLPAPVSASPNGMTPAKARAVLMAS